MKTVLKISQTYNAIAIMFFNICIFILFLNICIFVVFEIKDNFLNVNKNNPIAKKYNNPLLKKIYPGLSEEDINDLLIETWSRPYIYEDFTLFKERPYKGRYVNVDENGFRITKNQGPWPPSVKNMNIFMFGGSSTFGYGLPDDQTIASYLQEFLSNRLKQEVRVYNFGRGSYYSQQERILFEKLLFSGFIPDLAIFTDGFNDIYLIEGNPAFSEDFEQCDFTKQGKNAASLESKLISKLPMIRLAKLYLYNLKKLDKIATKMQIDQNNRDFTEHEYNSKSMIADVINRYVKNKKMIEAIAKAYAVKTLFVWQPVPSYKYDSHYDLFGKRDSKLYNLIAQVYQYMEDFIKKEPLGKNFIWLADIQENLQLPLYVDAAHYSSEMSEILSVTIGNQLLESHLLMEIR